MYYHKYYNANALDIKCLEFRMLTTTEIKKLSVVKVCTPLTFDALGYPVPGGLYDSKLGPLKLSSDPCATCGNILMNCFGHYGHIELPLPVINPLFTSIILNIFKISCLNCYTIQIPCQEKCVLIGQLRLIENGFLNESQELEEYLLNTGNLDEVEEYVSKYCSEVLRRPQNSYCKNIEDYRRHCLSSLFKKGSTKLNCFKCNKPIITFKFQNHKIILSEKLSSKSKINEKICMMPSRVRDYMRELWKNEKSILTVLINALNNVQNEYPTDACFITDILVTPSITRPAQFLNNKQVEHPKNLLYKLILQDCLQIKSIITVINKNNTDDLSKEMLNVVYSSRGESNTDKLQIAWHSLQINVNGLLDSNMLRFTGNLNVKTESAGLKQLIEKKSGILRQNMMGKRVDYFARTVITPDPLLDIDEIGIPEEFAKKLTYPVPVTPWNVTELRKIVFNGPNVHPGANVVENDDGCMTWIPSTNTNRRKGLAKTLLTPGVDSQDPKIVHRHLMNGDVMFINRQPSLHKPSIMAHKARILKHEKTFRLHYANCKAYNADFDGDEMNAHFVQNELSRAEASILANVSNQYLVPRDGTPLSGLIQDHVIAGVRLTVRGKFFNRLEYHQLVYQALCFLVDDIVLLPPCIIKPSTLWSGKQIISTIIINLTPKRKNYLNLESVSKIGLKTWAIRNKTNVDLNSVDKNLSEVSVIIRNGEFLCGILDKNHVGATHYGLIQSFYELYGGKYSTQLLGAFSKLLTYYLQKDGFTLGVEDILVKKRPDANRLKIIEKTKLIGHEAACKALGVNVDLDYDVLQKELEKAYKKHSNFQSYIDREYKLLLDKYTDNINTVCLPKGLLRTFPENNLQLMVQSGAKGSTVNTMQISCLLGQIELEGKRPPLMISGRSLPSFTPYNTCPEAGGFITSRFMTGLQPQEFFFHCMAGREGLIDTAVKTSRSGYLQRCLIKHLEGLVINYDLTVRDSDNSVIQFMYGEDGQDIIKSQLLKSSQLTFMVENFKSVIDKKLVKQLKKKLDNTEMANIKMMVKNWLSENRHCSQRHGNNNKAFKQFCHDVKQLNGTTVKKPGRTETATELCELWSNLDPNTKSRYNDLFPKCPDPVNSVYNPSVYFSSVSEKVEEMIDNYLERNDLPIKKSEFRDAIYFKTMTSSCEPGEAVGILAGQSVGEPSTQMTLNTFHFAGRGEMNVTLGIPRLREILMFAAKQIKTPSMEIPFKSNVNKLEKKAEKLRKGLNMLTLKDVLENITVKESVNLNLRQRQYMLKMTFIPHSLYKDMTNIKPKDIINYLQRDFGKKLNGLFRKHLKRNYGTDLIVQNKTKQHETTSANDDENDYQEENYKDNDLPKVDSSDENSDVDGEGDATEMKSKNRNKDMNDYEDADDYVTDENDIDGESRFGESGAEDSENYLSAGNDSGIGTDHLKNSDEDNETDEKLAEVKSRDNIETSYVKKFKYDEQTFCWCSITCKVSLTYKRLDLSSLLPNLAGASIIHEVPGIKRAITYENDGKLVLKTEGSYGVQKLFRYEELLDLNKLYSNDIHAIATTYGIEAANRVIVKEIQDVFQVYGINVDPRHLLLIADYMTFDGTYKPLNRVGMDGCSSPFQQMSFESTLKYLKNAVVYNLKDNVRSPSSSLVVGTEPKVGCGLMKVFHEIQ